MTSSLTHKLKLGNQRLLAPPLSLGGVHVPPTSPTVGAIFKDADLREQYFVEIIGTGNVTEPL